MQPWNAPTSIKVGLLFPIEVTLLGIVTEVKLLQQANAPPPIEVTLLGIVTEVKVVQGYIHHPSL